MKRTISGLLLLLGTVLFSCKKESSAPVTDTSLSALVNSDSSLTIFAAAISRASETAQLQRTDSFTLAAPVNDAYRAAGIDIAAINALPVSTVDSMIKYLFISGFAKPAAGASVTYTSTLGLPVYGYADGGGTYFNGSNASPQTTSTTNAVFYKTANLLLPPSYSLPQWLQTDPTLTLFTEAIQRTGLINNLTSGWYTVFAPDNAAFASAGYPDIASIDNADLNTLTNLINYHIANTAYFSYNLAGTIPTDEGGSIVVTAAGGAIQLAGHNNTGLAQVTKANVLLAGNIIVHKINGVLLP